MKASGDAGFDWDMLMRFGLGALGLRPGDFWSMTPREFDAAIKGRLGLFHDETPMTGARLNALAERFPDEGTK